MKIQVAQFKNENDANIRQRELDLKQMESRAAAAVQQYELALKERDLPHSSMSRATCMPTRRRRWPMWQRC